MHINKKKEDENGRPRARERGTVRIDGYIDGPRITMDGKCIWRAQSGRSVGIFHNKT